MAEAVQKKKQRQTSIRFPPEVRLKLGYLALKRELSLNDVVIRGLMDWYHQQPEAKEFGPITLDVSSPTKSGPKPQEKPPTQKAPTLAKKGKKAPTKAKPKTKKKP